MAQIMMSMAKKSSTYERKISQRRAHKLFKEQKLFASDQIEIRGVVLSNSNMKAVHKS